MQKLTREDSRSLRSWLLIHIRVDWSLSQQPVVVAVAVVAASLAIRSGVVDIVVVVVAVIVVPPKQPFSRIGVQAILY